MHLVYIDDSKDERSCCFSAIILPADKWLEALDHLIAFRRQIRADHGIYMNIELHATDWLGGRGNVARDTVRRDVRADIFRQALRYFTGLPGCSVINAHAPRGRLDTLLERLCSRLQVNMAAQDSRAMIISDEGKSFDSMTRRMRRHYLVQGRYGGLLQRPLDRIIEDPVYRKSERSLFIQAADFCAFSLLRMEAPTEAIRRHNLQDAFMELRPILETRAFAGDPRGLGIIRA